MLSIPLSRPISIPIVRGFFHERNPILKSGDKKCQPAANTPCRTDHGSPSGSSGKAKGGESEGPWFETDRGYIFLLHSQSMRLILFLLYT